MARIITALVVSLLLTGWASADELSDSLKAREISQMISASELCGYQVDMQRVRQFAEEELANMDDLARITFQTAGRAMKTKLQEMNEVERVGTCGLLKGLGRRYKLLAQ